MHNIYTIVNATALSAGGALTILRQFIFHAALTDRKYLIFISSNIELDNHENITYIRIDNGSWFKRILWDAYGLNKYLKDHCIRYPLLISLQNTSVNVSCEQVIYLHQPLPFTTVKFNLNRDTFKYYLYKVFYKFFIFIFATKTTRFVVQTEWMKSALLNNDIPEQMISVFTPDITLPEFSATREFDYLTKRMVTSSHTNFFYPASTLFYKNHLMILDALLMLNSRPLKRKPIFSVTFDVGAYPAFDERVKQNNLTDQIAYLGIMSYNKVIEQYLIADAVLFPSYIETFGLPLAESGVLGKHLICSDLPFAHDVLNNYSGAEFLNYKDTSLWADAMEFVINKDFVLQYPSLSYQQSATWKNFFESL